MYEVLICAHFLTKFEVMNKLLTLLIILSLTHVFGQKNKLPPKEKKVVNKTNFGIGFGAARSVVFLSRNVKEFNDATGWTFNAIYGGHKLIRFAFDYSQFSSIDIEPTWIGVKAKTYELNIQFIARFKNIKSIIYPITGFSLNQFNGLFTGKEDFQNLREKYPSNSYVKSSWFGTNFGLGYEQTIGPVKAVITYKMRVGTSDVNAKINIMDVCYGLGVRYDMKASTPRHFYRTIFRNTRNRYALDVD